MVHKIKLNVNLKKYLYKVFQMLAYFFVNIISQTYDYALIESYEFPKSYLT